MAHGVGIVDMNCVSRGSGGAFAGRCMRQEAGAKSTFSRLLDRLPGADMH